MKVMLNKSKRGQKGQALILVLILLLVGTIIITPLLNYMGTGLMAGKRNEVRMQELYAADAGVEDALWKISNNAPGVPQYGDLALQYTIANVNGKQVSVAISYIWILDGIEDPKNGQMPHAELVATGRIVNLSTGEYEVMIRYDGTNGNVRVERIGVWLPTAFSYTDNSSSGITTNNPTIGNIRAGRTLIWDLTPAELFKTNEVTIKYQRFRFTPTGQYPRGNFAWVRTTRNDIYLSWDGQVASYVVTSTATDNITGKQTQVVAYISKESGAVPPYSVSIVTWGVTLK